jgi:hypothetical protein
MSTSFDMIGASMLGEKGVDNDWSEVQKDNEAAEAIGWRCSEAQ